MVSFRNLIGSSKFLEVMVDGKYTETLPDPFSGWGLGTRLPIFGVVNDKLASNGSFSLLGCLFFSFLTPCVVGYLHVIQQSSGTMYQHGPLFCTRIEKIKYLIGLHVQYAGSLMATVWYR